MEALHETPIPPFLSKTYDPSLDRIISWGDKGKSFVVWCGVREADFAKEFLQLRSSASYLCGTQETVAVRDINNNKNVQGFRKIDSDKWEFRNGGFVQGQRHQQKTIQRRKSHHRLEGPSTAWQAEIRELRRERRLMIEEVMGLQNEQRLTVQHMQVVKEKLEAAETRHKQMISFLARLINSSIPSSSRTMRKFIGEDELIHAPKKDDSVGAINPPADKHFTSSPQNVVMENGVPGFSIAGDAWSMGLEAGDPWG
ncbi:hypothetical protein SASPL_108618 [Salvia splendens]|uniref:HSF-type DNA-binding domain-containing protein n=1 Tax=Salvia splendens TaxID=180675 RepID=A0A8X8YJ51_SALSN|nr:hypothetical protein SASPL_108618 [Salvia splendens]